MYSVSQLAGIPNGSAFWHRTGTRTITLIRPWLGILLEWFWANGLLRCSGLVDYRATIQTASFRRQTVATVAWLWCAYVAHRSRGAARPSGFSRCLLSARRCGERRPALAVSDDAISMFFWPTTAAAAVGSVENHWADFFLSKSWPTCICSAVCCALAGRNAHGIRHQHYPEHLAKNELFSLCVTV